METTPSHQDSSQFSLLHRKIQRWIWEQGWTELRDVQEQAIQPILSGQTDVLLGSTTASGKTEAAFLPILSYLLNEKNHKTGVRVLYISPLKALINDQYDRLHTLSEQLEIPVHRWHGDVGGSKKKKVQKNPSGVLLITPESLEAIHIKPETNISRLFGQLAFVVVDEIHSFIGTERGIQLQSLIHRIELTIRRPIPRIGLSATIGDMEMAAAFLRPRSDFPRQIIVSEAGGQIVHLSVRGSLKGMPKTDASSSEQEEKNHDAGTGDNLSIAQDLYHVLRGSSHLIFANSRQRVEIIADLLRRLCEQNRVPNEFWPHHGSLSKEIREDSEAALKESGRPATAVCTSTLEMGIDIGFVDSIAQIGPPPSVAGLRQRLGRSGRREKPPCLRVYIEEFSITPNTAPQDLLRTELVQTIAMISLMGQRWYEPPLPGKLHFSTLVQQLLSIIAQFGGISASRAWQALCQSGPFQGINTSVFRDFLRSLGEKDLITQMDDGTLVLGMQGEQLVNHFSFYSAFQTNEEYRLICDGRTLGSIPIHSPLTEGTYLIFAGHRWKVIAVHEQEKVVILTPAPGGCPPTFSGSRAMIHDEIRKKMRGIYTSMEIPPYLDQAAAELLSQGRFHFNQMNLATCQLLAFGQDTLLFPWCGDRVLNTLVAVFQSEGMDATHDGVAINIDNLDLNTVRNRIENLVSASMANPLSLAAKVKNNKNEKYHAFLDDDLLTMEYASTHFDVEGCWKALEEMVGSCRVL